MIEKTIVEIITSEMNYLFKENDGWFLTTRDIFTARLQSFALETKKYLEAAIIGEIGNNTFDHNFGFNTVFPKGTFWHPLYKQRYTVLADYGKGLRQSLLQVLPSIASDTEAIEIAFTKRISGRAPEQRGNGLKFVSESIQKNNWHLFFQSGLGSCSIDKNGASFFEGTISLPGCLAIIDFYGEK